MKGERLDVALVERGLCESREQARRLILAGEVRVNGHCVDKASRKVLADNALEIMQRPRFVSRGGLKLEAALNAFEINPAGWVCADIGSSTGGFTDCLLQYGAAKVFCFDVGTNQLAWKIRSHPQVIAREQFNARNLQPEDVSEPVRLAVMDLSFISLTLVLPAVWRILDAQGMTLCLIKPQFELERDKVGKGGVVREAASQEQAVEKIRRFALENDKEWRGVVDSPITGMDGNREFLAWIA